MPSGCAELGSEGGSRGFPEGPPRAARPGRQLTEAEEAHQQQHQKPVRQAPGVAERGQRPGDGGGFSAGLVGAVGQEPPRFLLLLLHGARGRPGSESSGNPGTSRGHPGWSPGQTGGHVTTVAHVTPRKSREAALT